MYEPSLRGHRSAEPSSIGERESRSVRLPTRRTNSEFFDGQVLVQVYVSHSPSLPAAPGMVRVRVTSTEPGVTTPENWPGNLQVRLENRSPVPIDLDFVEVSSGLVNFNAALQRLKLAPGQNLQTSSVLMPIDATEQIPVKVRMRLGNREETKEIMLPLATVARADP